MKTNELSNQKFGRLRVLNRTLNNIGQKVAWDCMCDCGKLVTVVSNKLTSGRTKSCGCWRVDFGRSVGQKTTHNLSNTPTYVSWQSMKSRCTYEYTIGWQHYGGRGITVCDRWSGSFENFLEDMGLRPSLSFSLDRIDPNGNYEPGNCRWATSSEQNLNKRRNNAKV